MLTVRCTVGESIIIGDDIKISIEAIEGALVQLEIHTLDNMDIRHQEPIRQSVAPPPAGQDENG
ncbi:MAG: carbon storage regulator [Porticoccaceae bacterium]